MTRLGLHVNADRAHDRAIDYCRAVKPAVMKWLAPSRDTLTRCREVSPATRHVIRVYWPDQNIATDQYVQFRSRAVSVAREYAGLASWVEGWNEFGTSDANRLAAFCRAEVDLAKRLNDAGMGAAIGGFSTGAFDTGGDKKVGGQYVVTPSAAAVRPMLEFLHATGKANVLHFHEYAGPYMQYMVRTPDGRNQWDHAGNGFTGASSTGIWDTGVDGWLTLRYRMLRRVLVSLGLDAVRFLVTESGIDDVNPRPGGANRKGWRDYDGTEWSRLPGIGNFAAQMRWYMWQVSHDPYVVGVVDFGFGTVDPAWGSFDLSQTPDMLAAVMGEQTTLPVGTMDADVPPSPPPTPAPESVMVAGCFVVPGDGWTSIARRMLGRDPLQRDVAAVKALNDGMPLRAGCFVRSPFHVAVRR